MGFFCVVYLVLRHCSGGKPTRAHIIIYEGADTELDAQCKTRTLDSGLWTGLVSSPDPTHYAGKGLVTFEGFGCAAEGSV